MVCSCRADFTEAFRDFSQADFGDFSRLKILSPQKELDGSLDVEQGVQYDYNPKIAVCSKIDNAQHYPKDCASPKPYRISNT
jgi:hypothetical protein